MKKLMKGLLSAPLACLAFAGQAAAVAQDATAMRQATGSTTVVVAAPAAPTSGFRAEFLKELEGLERRYVDLAERVPADKYGWRPGEGVRSISEVLMHVAAANYNLPQRIGTPAPAGFKAQGFDTSTADKAKVLDTLRQSFAHLRRAAINVADADAEKSFDLFGGKVTPRGFLLFVTRHLGEHLGQTIAYARLNGVVPPWTEERMQQQQQRQQQQPSPAQPAQPQRDMPPQARPPRP